MGDKIRLGEYPYTYVRVLTMKSKLLKKEDYDRLLKMNLSELTKFLQESEYKKEIDKLALVFSGVELLEHSLNESIVNSFEKLKRISPDELDLLINAYLHRNDFFNLKTVIRGKYSKVFPDEIKKLLKPVGLYKLPYFEKLLELSTVEEIINAVDFVDNKAKKEMAENFTKTQALFEIENTLDRIYFEGLFEFCSRLPAEGKLFKEFIMNEIDILNIKTLIRLKKEKIDKEIIKKSICGQGHALSREKLNHLVKLDFDNVMINLAKTPYKKIISKYAKEQKEMPIIKLEAELDKFLLDKASLLLHQNPLSVDIILGYMFAKEIEVRNLNLIVKGRQLGIKEEFLAEQLVI